MHEDRPELAKEPVELVGLKFHTITVAGVLFRCTCGIQDFAGVPSVKSHAWSHTPPARVVDLRIPEWTQRGVLGGTLGALAARIHETATSHGFWQKDRNFGEMLALIHSEISEALEEHRDGNPPVHVPIHVQDCSHSGEGLVDPDRTDCGNATCKPEGTAVELVDAMIRILDTMYSLDVDIDAVVERKMAYNAQRPHKHGKAY